LEISLDIFASATGFIFIKAKTATICSWKPLWSM